MQAKRYQTILVDAAQMRVVFDEVGVVHMSPKSCCGPRRAAHAFHPEVLPRCVQSREPFMREHEGHGHNALRRRNIPPLDLRRADRSSE